MVMEYFMISISKFKVKTSLGEEFEGGGDTCSNLGRNNFKFF